MNSRAALANLKGLVGMQQMLSHQVLLYICLANENTDDHSRELQLEVARTAVLKLRRIYKTVVKGDEEINIPEAVSLVAAESIDSQIRQSNSVMARYISGVESSISAVQSGTHCDVSELAALASNELSAIHVDIMNAIQADLDKVAKLAEQQREQTSDIIEETLNQVQLISSKVKIISLNVAVEAARLGRSGAPIAVIATEVRHLSEESDQAAQKIKDTLN